MTNTNSYVENESSSQASFWSVLWYNLFHTMKVVMLQAHLGP